MYLIFRHVREGHLNEWEIVCCEALAIIRAFLKGLLNYVDALKACSIFSFFPHFVVSGLFSFILFCRHGQSLFKRMGIKCYFLSLSRVICSQHPKRVFFSVCFYLFIKLQLVQGKCITVYIFCFCLVKGSPFTVWSRSEYSHACYTYCQQFFFSCFYLPGPFNFIFS